MHNSFQILHTKIYNGKERKKDINQYPCKWESKHVILVLTIICDALRDLVPFVLFKNMKNIHGGVLLLVKLTLLKVTLLHGCFSYF